MNLILNDSTGTKNFSEALKLLTRGSSGVGLAVSYLQIGGWELLWPRISNLDPHKVKIVCTDQMGITHPAAIRRALNANVLIRNFVGNETYHPKVYLSYDSIGKPKRFLLASANLSSSAFTKSVEAGLIGEDQRILNKLGRWFDYLFKERSEDIDQEHLRAMEETWRRAAPRRVRDRLLTRRTLLIPDPHRVISISPADVDAIEDVFATIQLPLGLLNIDYAGNNIRNLGRIREVLSNWDSVRNRSFSTAGKQKSELKLLGFVQENELTTIGIAASQAQNDQEIAHLWCSWLQRTNDKELASINPRLLLAKRVFPQFWRFQPEVRDFFLKNVQNPEERQVLNTIELLCNASDLAQDLTLEDFRTLAPMLNQEKSLPSFVQRAVEDYKQNKGMRGWDFPDRGIVPTAWNETSKLLNTLNSKRL